MKKLIPILTLAVIVILPTSAFSKPVPESFNQGEVPFTLEDRDRLIRLEEGLKEGLKATNQRIDDTNRRIDELKDSTNRQFADLKGLMLWGFGILFAGMFTLIGFVLWDRRTALSPAIKKYKELEDKEDKIEKALKEYAFKEPRLAEILRSVGIM